MLGVTAILTAGGSGTRMNNNIPKQFITVNEIPIIIYTLQKFQNNPDVDKIIIACLKEWQPMLKAYISEFNISKAESVVEGGETGIESIRKCFEVIEESERKGVVLIHDGNRPLVSDEIIHQNIVAAKSVGATTTYIDIHDGIVRVDDDLNIQASDFKREEIKPTQTPHCFTHDIISDIFQKIDDAKKYISIADAATQLGYDVKLVKGSEVNFKITTPNDLAIFEAITSKRFGNVQ